MNKRGLVEETIMPAFELLLAALVTILIVVFIINPQAQASTLEDKFVSIDTSLLLDTVQLSPGRVNLNYNYGDRKLSIQGDKIISNNIQFSYIPDINQDSLIRQDKTNLRIKNINFAFPVSQRVVTSCFGNRNIKEGTNYHEGIDLRANYEDVIAIADGIILSYVNGPGTDNTLTIKHGDNIVTRYLHLSNVKKEIVLDNNFKCIKNCEVKKGEVIAVSGQQGKKGPKQYDPHLHFELIIDGAPRDPINYIFESNDFLCKENSNCFEDDYRYAYRCRAIA